jgi:maltokinase
MDTAHHVTDGPFAGRIAGLLAAWLPEQRWFGGKGRPIRAVSLASCLPLLDFAEGPRLWHVLAAVSFEDGASAGGAAEAPADPPQLYQVYVGVRDSLPDGLRHAAIGSPDHGLPELGGICYDALHDADLAGWLLERLVHRDRFGPLRFERLAGHEVRTDQRSLVLTGEQSNTSVVFGDQYIAKVLRRLVLGRSPELELGLALGAAGSRHVAPLIGWAEFEQSGLDQVWLGHSGFGRDDVGLDDFGSDAGGPDGSGSAKTGSVEFGSVETGSVETGSVEAASVRIGSEGPGSVPGPASVPSPGSGSGSVRSEPITLVTLQAFLPSATDGWALALTSVRDLFGAPPDISAARAGADFAPEAHRLGRATARVHRALATVLSTGWLEPAQTERMAAAMTRRLEATACRVPALREHVPGLAEALARLGELPGPLPVQRVHGDYHLGQAMRTVTGWVLLDFEGEPARSLAERRAPASPLKDIAGMLRSFDYAAHHLLGTLSPQSDQPPGVTELMRVRAAEWAARNRDAFCRGYAEAVGYDPRAESAALRAFEIEKAVYEVEYEAANRPSWLPIPLAACARLASR